MYFGNYLKAMRERERERDKEHLRPVIICSSQRRKRGRKNTNKNKTGSEVGGNNPEGGGAVFPLPRE